jgi:hypothetical protein
MISNMLVQGEPVSWHFNNVYKMNNYNIIYSAGLYQKPLKFRFFGKQRLKKMFKNCLIHE